MNNLKDNEYVDIWWFNWFIQFERINQMKNIFINSKSQLNINNFHSNQSNWKHPFVWNSFYNYCFHYFYHYQSELHEIYWINNLEIKSQWKVHLNFIPPKSPKKLIYSSSQFRRTFSDKSRSIQKWYHWKQIPI